jgi:hypothetical protein
VSEAYNIYMSKKDIQKYKDKTKKDIVDVWDDEMKQHAINEIRQKISNNEKI